MTDISKPAKTIASGLARPRRPIRLPGTPKIPLIISATRLQRPIERRSDIRQPSFRGQVGVQCNGLRTVLFEFGVTQAAVVSELGALVNISCAAGRLVVFTRGLPKSNLHVWPTHS